MPSFYVQWAEVFEQYFEECARVGDDRYVDVTTDTATEAATDPNRVVKRIGADRLKIVGYSPTARACLAVSVKRTAWSDVTGAWDGTNAVRATPAEEAGYYH